MLFFVWFCKSSNVSIFSCEYFQLKVEKWSPSEPREWREKPAALKVSGNMFCMTFISMFYVTTISVFCVTIEGCNVTALLDRCDNAVK